jgi:lysophospholipase L1-like esterase
MRISRRQFAGLLGTGVLAGQQPREWYRLRGGLPNAVRRFQAGGPARVAFLGGSITEMKGWRDLVCDNLSRRYPKAQFDFINAGISSTGSTPGAFRLVRDVFGRGPVDLLFEEAAVNDSTNGYSAREQVRGMEGIVRHARLIQPEIDVVLLHFADPDKLASYRSGNVPEVIASHEKVAERYAVPSIDLAKEVADRIAAGEFTWEKDFKDLHPAPFGMELYARSIERLFDAASGDAGRRELPEPLDQKSYFRGRLVDIGEAVREDGWRIEPDWTPRDGAATRKRFVHVPVLVTEKAGATCRWTFDGTAAGIFVVAGPDASVVEYSIDGSAWRKRDLFTQWSDKLHIPWAHVLDGDLDAGRHELRMRLSGEGKALRIVSFLGN